MDFWTPALLLCCALISGLDEVAGEIFHFGYEGENGPEYWADHYPACGGQYQSPINIEDVNVQQIQLSPLRFLNFDALPTISTLTNNGHTAMLQMETSEEMSISGGPLKGEYVFSQLHFHWGESDATGSEDTINNRSYPMEMHAVTYKKAYGTFAQALTHPDGLAVMATFFEVVPEENEAYTDIVNGLPLIEEPEAKSQITQRSSLDMLVADKREQYYTYYGSLTTPPCAEVVTWVEFAAPVPISEEQLEVFRSLQGHEGPMGHNFRPTQAVGGRIVWFNEANIARRN